MGSYLQWTECPTPKDIYVGHNQVTEIMWYIQNQTDHYHLFSIQDMSRHFEKDYNKLSIAYIL